MIEKVLVKNHLDELLELDLRNPHKEGLAVRGIEGLVPVKADINVTPISSGDGGLYNSARTNDRNIVIYLNYLEEPTIEAVRRKTYKYFPLKKNIELTIVTNNDEVRTIEGYVESNEGVLFSKTTGTQISIVCPDPYFKAPQDTVNYISGVIPSFEFPFSNESTTEELIEFGTVDTSRATEITYEGDGDPGVEMIMFVEGIVEFPMIYNATTQKYVKINTDKLTTLMGGGLVANDRIEINTKKGAKQAWLIRGGQRYNILNALDDTSTWITLVKGLNTFSYIADTGQNDIRVEIRHRALYEGV